MFDNNERSKFKEQTFIHNTERKVATLPCVTHRRADEAAPPVGAEEWGTTSRYKEYNAEVQVLAYMYKYHFKSFTRVKIIYQIKNLGYFTWKNTSTPPRMVGLHNCRKKNPLKVDT